jgi:gamma-glutamylcyclotransferase (GGCT)/AIG2-like uncharacterized protein YtfP
MHVFTYGTLMFPEVWRAVVGQEFGRVRGAAPGYAVYRVKNAVFPGIVECAAVKVAPGVVYLDVDAPAMARLDLFEDDFYERRAVSVDCEDGERRLAEAYVVPEVRRTVLTTEPWRAEEFVARGDLTKFIQRFAGFSRLAGAD